jgi:SAM-dependent methyltransferase
MVAGPTLDYTRYYRWWHDESDAHFEQEVAAAEEWLSRYRPNDRSARILDIGCGMGFVVASFLRAGYRAAEGIDADRGQASLAAARNLPVHYVPVAETHRWMRDRAGRYAVVTAVDVLEHIPRDHQLDFLEGVHNLLEPGGTFLCRVPNANSSLASVYRYGDWTHHASFTEHSLDFVLYNAGFAEIRIEATRPQPLSRRLVRPGQWLLGFFRLFRRLEMISEFGWAQGSRIPLTLNILAIAKRVSSKAPPQIASGARRHPPRPTNVCEIGSP